MGAVIWCAIVVVWVLVLIPVWLRRQDDAVAVAARRVAAPPLTTARRVLSRRSPGAPVRRWVVLAPGETGRDELADPATAAASAVATEDATPPRGARRRGRPARRAYLGRRRRLGALLAAVVLTVALVPLRGGRAALLLQLVADIALAAYLVHLRRAARAGRTASTAARRVPAVPTTVARAGRVVSRKVEAGGDLPAAVRPETQAADDEEPEVTLPTAARVSAYGPDRPWRRQLRPQATGARAGGGGVQAPWVEAAAWVEAPRSEPVSAALGASAATLPAPRPRPALLRDDPIDGEDVTDVDLLLGRRAVGH